MRSWLVTAVAVLVVTAGCRGPDGDASWARYDRDVGPVGLDAVLPDAALDLTERCVTLRTVDGASVVPVFRDRDVRWADDGALSFRGERYAIGDLLSVGGGYSGTVADAPAGVVVPEDCDPQAALWLVGDYSGSWTSTSRDS